MVSMYGKVIAERRRVRVEVGVEKEWRKMDERGV